MANGLLDSRGDIATNELWWVGMVKGFFALFFGILALFWPGLNLVTLIYLFSGFAVAIGITEVVHGLFSIDRRETWWVTLVAGLIALGVGVYLVRNTSVSLKTFLLIAGVALIARGLLDLVLAFIEQGGRINRTLVTLTGITTILTGIVILMQPDWQGLAFVWVLGLYALIYGPLKMAISFDMRSELIDALASSAEDAEAEIEETRLAPMS